MKRTFKKLKSNSGATIIIALLFMMICVFVGGSVLVAATVNGGRLQNERSDEQNLLTQRSIATVIASELSEDGVVRFSADTVQGQSGVKRALIQSAINARGAADKTGTAHFSVSDPMNADDKTDCTVATQYGHGIVTSVISFDDSPKIRLIAQATDSNGTFSWYNLKVEKGGN